MRNFPILLLILVVCFNLSSSQNELLIVEDIDNLYNKRDDDMPVITPSKNSTELAMYESFVLECDANEAIEWWYSDEGDMKICDFKNINDHQRPFGIRLQLENVTVENTGAYFCIKRSQVPHSDAQWSEHMLKELVKNKKASTIFIFVNDTNDDPNDPPAPEELEPTAADDNEIVMPYTPSIPETKVGLKNKEKTIYSDKSTVTHIKHDAYDKNVPLPNITVPDYQNNKPIEKSNTHKYVFVGKTFELMCKMSPPNGIAYTTCWTWPSQVDESRMNITSSRIDEMPCSILVVRDTKFTDQGLYECSVKLGQSLEELGQSFYNISVIHPNTSYLQVASPSEEYTLSEPANKTILLTANFKGFPPPSFSWYKPNGFEVGETEENWKIIFTESSITLTMVNAQLKDSGIYTLKGTNGHDTKQLAFNVSVISPPVVSMDDVYVMEDRKAHLKCTVLSYPTADVTFHFQPCSLKPRWPTCQTPSQNFSYIKNTTPGQLSVEYVHEAIFSPTEPGYIICVAKNLIDNSPVTSQTKAQLILTDIPKSLTIDGLEGNLRLPVGHEKTFTCAASAYQFNGNMEWFYNSTPIVEGNGITISTTSTEYSYRKILKFNSTTAENQGTYRCLAWYINESLKFEMIEINIYTYEPMETWMWVCIIFILFLVALCAFLVVRYCKERKRCLAPKPTVLANFNEGTIDRINPALSWNEQAELLPYDHKFEFPRHKLKLGKRLGSGAFGVVLEGEAQGILIDESKSMVAVKMVNRTADIEEVQALASELKIMVHLGKHLNVVNLLGAVTKNIAKRELMVIVEYCRFGNIQSFLLRNRKYFIDQINPINDRIDTDITAKCIPDIVQLQHDYVNGCGVNDGSGIKYADVGLPDHLYMNNINGNTMTDNTKAMAVTTTDLVSWAFQVARGMDYLSSKGVLHGDLAARNILLCENNVVKICDFGLARSMYRSVDYKKSVGCKLPIKWLALESLNDLVFSTYSDVWSFGIVLWELFSLSTVPYPGIDPNHELFNKLKDGYRMEKPPYANQEIYDIMLECWQENPDNRPLFNVLERRFANMLSEDVVDHYLHLNDPYMHANVECMKYCSTDYLSMMGTPEVEGPKFPYMRIPEAPIGYLQMKRIEPQSCHPQVPEAEQTPE